MKLNTKSEEEEKYNFIKFLEKLYKKNIFFSGPATKKEELFFPN